MTTAVSRAAGPRPSTALRVARAIARVHVPLAICLAGYSALWVTTLQSSEGQLDRLGISRLDIKLMWFSLAAVIILALVGARLVSAATGVDRRRRAALGVHVVAVLNAAWQATMVYQPWVLEFAVAPLLVAAALLLVRGDRPAPAPQTSSAPASSASRTRIS